MKNTLRQAVRDLLVAEYPGTLTNQQLAYRLGANEPSVRVITRTLSERGELYAWSGGYGNVPVDWRMSSHLMETSNPVNL